MVGDGDVDVIGAARAGIRSVWLTRGREWPRSDVRPTAVADTLSEALGRVSAWRR
jgi:putative hydrolase of the HAD superfamily